MGKKVSVATKQGLFILVMMLVVALTLVSCYRQPAGMPTTPSQGAGSSPPAAEPTTTTEPAIPHNSPPATKPAITQPGPAVLEVISNLNVSAGPGNITDVWAQTAADGKAYAYVGTFDLPTCGPDITGVHIIDVSDIKHPVKVGFLQSPSGTRSNDVKVASIKTDLFNGDILVHSAEFCRGLPERPPLTMSPGVVLYDVTNPLQPKRLAADFSLGMEVHNTYIYQQGANAYLLVVQDGAERDFHIVDITNPDLPRVIVSLGGVDWFGPDDQMALGAVPFSFLHDVWAQSYPPALPNANYAGKTIAYLSYWDAGLVLLDITDPANPIFLGDSDYRDTDPLTRLPPEGNSHAAVPTADGNLVFMGDEDFAPSRAIFTVDTGGFQGEFRAVEADFTRKLIDVEGQQLTGTAVYIGTACNITEIPPPPQAPGVKHIALIEKGGCPFDEKVSHAAAAGYDGALVFNIAEEASQLMPMDGDPAKGVIPAFFISRFTAFAIMGISPVSPTDTRLPPVGTAGARITIRHVFDGWGYGRILDVSNPAGIKEVGQFATANALSPEMPPGDHSMHNVIVDHGRAYISWYGDGIVVVDSSNPAKPREVASFVDKVQSSDFWGIYLYQHPDGNTYILGSDRTTGLWVFRKP